MKTMVWVHKFACNAYAGSVSFENEAKAEGYAAGYRACGEDGCAPLSAYAESEAELKLMRRDQPESEVLKALVAP
jgi:hypothetical protein